MPHVLSRLRNVPLAKITPLLKEHAPLHAKEGMFLEHIWQNADDPHEVIFLFRANDLDHTKKYIEKVHSQAIVEDPNANLPKVIFLRE